MIELGNKEFLHIHEKTKFSCSELFPPVPSHGVNSHLSLSNERKVPKNLSNVVLEVKYLQERCQECELSPSHQTYSFSGCERLHTSGPITKWFQ